MITYVSVKMDRFFGNLYEGCDFLNALSETKNVQGQN